MKELSLENLPKDVYDLHESVKEIKLLLLSINKQNQVQSDDLLTIKEVSKLLSLTVNTIYSLVRKGKIPVAKKGKRLYFSKQKILEWVRSGTRKTKLEIDEEANKIIETRKGKSK